MAPPGRRKLSLSPVMLFFSLFLLFSATASAASAVIGIDLGTEYLKAAIANPGSPIEVVLTKDSKRKEAATIAFKPSRAQAGDPEAYPERLYGGDAVALSARYPSDVFANLKGLLGLPRYSDAVKDYGERYPGLVLQSVARFEDGNTRGTVGMASANFGDSKDVFMVEELLAMELKNIRANAEAAVGKGSVVTDAVITVPSFYTAEEKRAVELAADLAGLRLLGLISDGLAVGLNYATTRTFDSVTEGAKPEYHLVYDMGAGSTTATVLKFQGRTVKDYAKRNKTIQEVQVLGTGFDKSLGGDSLNDVIVKDMINQFVEGDRIKALGLEPSHVKRHAKTMARFWKDAERIRQVLSANSLATASFEGLYYDDVSFKYSLPRDHFEKLAKAHASRVSRPMTDALDAAGVTLGELDSIILHGGAVRTPFVQKQLEAATGSSSSKIKSNVNADEAAVLGAAFKAAGLSPIFRVKDIRATDVSGADVTLKWIIDGKDKQQKLFTALSQVGVDKQVPVKIQEDVKFQFIQTVGQAESSILEVEARNLTASVTELKDKHGCTSPNITTAFVVRLNPVDGLPQIVSGSVSCQGGSVKEGGVIDNVKGLFGFGSKKSAEQQVLEDDEENGEDMSTTMTPLPVSDPTSSGSTMSSPSASADTVSAASSSTAKAAKNTPSIITVPLALKTTTVGLNAPPTGQLPRIRQRMTLFDSSDRNVVLRSEALNTLEAFAYRARDYLTDDSFIAFSSAKAREGLEIQLSVVSDWLYGDGLDAKLQDFKDKLKALKALVEPVLKRKSEASKRAEAIETMNEKLGSLTSMIKMVEGSIEKAAKEAAASISSAASSAAESTTSAVSSSAGEDLEDDPYDTVSSEETPTATEIPVKLYEYTAEDLSSLTKMYDSAKSWLDEKLALQEKLTPYDDPAVLVADLELRAKQVGMSVSEMIMKSMRTQDLPKKAKNGGAKREKTKSKKSKSKSGSSSSSSNSGNTSSTTAEASSTTTMSQWRKDDL